ncbi:MAG: hypothetical protein AB8B72_13000 [Crocinitomicaceae bacterium]
MKNKLTILLLFLTCAVSGQNGIELCAYEEYRIFEFDQKFQLFQNDVLLVEQSNDSEFSLKINERKNLLFLNNECLNCSLEKLTYSEWDLNAVDNVLLEIIPINDSIRITNVLRFSRTHYNEPLKSVLYPDEDSLINGMTLYPPFDYGFSRSCLKSNTGKKTSEITPAYKYYKFCDLIIGTEYKFNRRGEIKSTILNFHKFENGKYISVRKREVPYNITSENIPFFAIEEVSEEISDFKYVNSNVFGIKKGEKWLLCKYENNGFQKQNIIIDTNRLDSIQSIPFFSPAYILHYPDSSVLHISHSRISGRAEFDTLTITNYYAEGIDPYIDKEIIVFSIGEDKHIIISHDNGYPRYGRFSTYHGEDPIKFFDLEVHRLDGIPRNKMIIKTRYNKK